MTEKDGWAPGAYEIAMGRNGTETATGETWRTFGIERSYPDRTWTLTHLPTGMAMADFKRKTDAKRFCRQIADLTDWTTVTGTTGLTPLPADVRAAVRAAMRRCHAVRLLRVS